MAQQLLEIRAPPTEVYFEVSDAFNLVGHLSQVQHPAVVQGLPCQVQLRTWLITACIHFHLTCERPAEEFRLQG